MIFEAEYTVTIKLDKLFMPPGHSSDELREEINSWISIVKKVDGPWISTNDSQYHLYVYADAMQRLVYQKTD